MPELPEVEATCRSVASYAVNQQFVEVIIRQRQLRWPICANLAQVLKNQTIENIHRRAKYILFTCTNGTLIVHLGMSGRLSIVTSNTQVAKHDHVDFILSNKHIIRYTDPRKFGSIHWTTRVPDKYKLLAHLGVEPLDRDFSGQYLFVVARNKKTAIKSLLMDSSIVVGIGNIYANEVLFLAGIRPNRAANTINLQECVNLAKHIKKLLRKAINKGGTTLKDFFNPDGSRGYFFLDLMVYGRSSQPCYKCNTILKSTRLNQRTTVFCPSCQH